MSVPTSSLEAEFLAHADVVERFIAMKLPQWLRPRVSPQDVLQEVWAEAFRHVDRFRICDTRATRTWLLNLADYKILDVIKQHERQCRSLSRTPHSSSRRPSLSQLFFWAAEEQLTPSKDAVRIESTRRLRAALDRLPENRATAIRLRYIDEQSLARTAAAMQLSESAVRSLLAQGLRQLRHFLNGTGLAPPDARPAG